MYCKKCGKFIEGDTDLCENCRQAPTYAQTTVIPPQPVNNGFKKALASTIVSICGFIAAIIGYIIGLVSAIGYNDAISRAFSALFLISAIVAGILSQIWGIQSIKKFVELKRAGYQKPIATLILGIVGTATGAFTLFYAFIILIVLFFVRISTSWFY